MSANDGYLKHEIMVWADRMGRSYAAICSHSDADVSNPFLAMNKPSILSKPTVNNTSSVLHINQHGTAEVCRSSRILSCVAPYWRALRCGFLVSHMLTCVGRMTALRSSSSDLGRHKLQLSTVCRTAENRPDYETRVKVRIAHTVKLNGAASTAV
jgi:hypothetical protein